MTVKMDKSENQGQTTFFHSAKKCGLSLILGSYD